jgi:hypothetical protein
MLRRALCLLLLVASNGRASDVLPARDALVLPGPVREETVFRLATAQPVLVNYPLLRQDFAELRRKSKAEIDDWLRAHTVISEAQSRQTEFNTSIATAEFTRKAFRPKDYNRGLVVPTLDGLLDEKGAGSDNPRYDWQDGDPRNGNVTLGEAIREFLYSELVHRILRDAGAGTGVVRCYAVMAAGFDVIHRDGYRNELGRSAAGLLFRQAHTRFENPEAAHPADQGRYYLWDQEASLRTERILRAYGLTSEGEGRREGEVEGGINIQGTRGNHILDFGNYVARGSFIERPVYHFYGTEPLLVPGADFPQPDPLKQIPLSIWGGFHGDDVGSKRDRPWVWAHHTADAIARHFHEGNLRAGRAAAMRHAMNMLKPRL